MSNRLLQIPYGTKDLLPGEAGARREMKNHIAEAFVSWGYDQVQTPTFEYLNTFAGGGQVSDSNFKFIDRANNILMLRTDMTAPLARLVATRLKGEPGIKRLFYLSQIFRYEDAQAGRQCEFAQAGIEMMGAAGAAADAEVIALAVEALLKSGLKDFTISMGHVEFINGLAEAAALDAEQVQAVKRCLITHNAVGLEKVIDANHISGQLALVFKDLLFLHGGEELLAEMGKKMLSQRCLNTLENLQAIYDLCRSYGVEKYLTFDLGLIRDFDYYTGMIFEGYTGGLGYPIIGGGRYDNMMQRFGTPCPATGFAIGIDRILLALERSGAAAQKSLCDVYVAYGPGQISEAIKTAMELRHQGNSVKLAAAEQTKEEAAAAAEANGCRGCQYIG